MSVCTLSDLFYTMYVVLSGTCTLQIVLLNDDRCIVLAGTYAFLS